MSTIASNAIRHLAPDLSDQVVTILYERSETALRPISLSNHSKSVRDVRYHMDYLAEALATDEPSLFHEYLTWNKSLFAGLNFPPDTLPATLNAMRHVFRHSLPAEVQAEVLQVLETGIQELEQADSVPQSFLTGDGPLDHLARRFLDALLAGNRHQASEMILAAVKGGVSIKDIYTYVFERTQREVGRLWQINQIGVAQEHFCTAATQMIMSQLYPYIFTGQRKGRKMLMVCVGGELHEIGARMVADFFEMEGWDTYFLGANTPQEAVLRAVEENQADILAISVTMTFHLGHVSALIESVRQQTKTKKTRVMVGGYPFNLSPNLWQKMGADGFAADAHNALQVAEQLVAP